MKLPRGRAGPVLSRLVGQPQPGDSPTFLGQGQGSAAGAGRASSGEDKHPSPPLLPHRSPAGRQRRNGDLKYCCVALKCRVNLQGLVVEMQYLDFNISIW